MRRVFLTGMSGAGKSTALAELERRGFEVVDTDVGGWTEWSDADEGYVWREDLIAELLSREGAVVLLSAPADVLLQRIERVEARVEPALVRDRPGDEERRTTNPYGKTVEERELILRQLEEVEPLLGATSTHEVDASRPVDEVVQRLVEIGESNLDD